MCPVSEGDWLLLLLHITNYRFYECFWKLTKPLFFFATLTRNFDIFIANLCNLFYHYSLEFIHYVTCCFDFKYCSLTHISNVYRLNTFTIDRLQSLEYYN